ncbi:aldolase/citrate lyase family protein [Pseudomonas putida]|uniref:aldolase/citrate lyase family protein n=1 Tax=Pseudomonas putida TaxID=303 RepID=UPI0021198D88|nr:aldolase/citrate lyase family protein [Pseudomonas putida]
MIDDVRASKHINKPAFFCTIFIRFCPFGGAFLSPPSSLGVERMPQIVAVQGVEAVFVRPVELAFNLGYLGNMHHPNVQAHIRKVAAVAILAGKVMGVLAQVKEDALRYQRWGCQLIAIGTDVDLLHTAAKAQLASYQINVDVPNPISIAY